MKECIKEERDRELNIFILKILKNRPLAESQILDYIISSKKFSVNTLPGLKKYHLNYLEKQNLIFRLDKNKKNFLKILKLMGRGKKKYYIIGENTKFKSLSSQEFLEKYWFKWEASKKKNKHGTKSNNYFHAYYFSTPKTAKWIKIFDNIIRKNILDKFSDFIKDRGEIEKCLDDITEIMRKVEIHPKKFHRTKKTSDDDFINSLSKEQIEEWVLTFCYLQNMPENEVNKVRNLSEKEKKDICSAIIKFPRPKRKPKMRLPFGFADYIVSDFHYHLMSTEWDSPVSIGIVLTGRLDSLHYLLNQKIEIKDIIDHELKKENFIEPNEYLEKL